MATTVTNFRQFLEAIAECRKISEAADYPALCYTAEQAQAARANPSPNKIRRVAQIQALLFMLYVLRRQWLLAATVAGASIIPELVLPRLIEIKQMMYSLGHNKGLYRGYYFMVARKIREQKTA
jgi:hypothetical protein